MPDNAATEVESRHLEVSKLLLDDENPRLPEDLHGKSQPKLLEYLYQTGNLTELAQSFVDNGFFRHEPLIVLQPERSRRVVVEGNRRLAALMILLKLPVAEGLSFPELKVTTAQEKALQSVPCFEVASRRDVYAFLGFRHIGGIKTWSAEAKARYIYREVQQERKRGSEDLFGAVSRRTGLDKGAIRTSYLAYAVMQAARENLSVDATRLLAHDERRFGVWTRAMQSPDVRSYLGLDEITTYEEIGRSLKKLKRKAVTEVIDDIAPAPGISILLPDSRNVTVYGRILRNPAAYEEMRRTMSLETAQAIVDRELLPVRMKKIVQQLVRLATDVLGAEESDISDLQAEQERLQEAVQRLDRAIQGATKPEARKR